MKRSVIILTNIILYTACFVSPVFGEKKNEKYFRVMEYNVENLFDCKHDTLKHDTDFTPEGEYEWHFGKYWKKLNAVARGIVLGSLDKEEMHIPDLIGLCEVENDSVVFDLTRRSLLRGAGYEYVMTQSPDLRGIDVALLYQPVSFCLIKHYGLRVEPKADMQPTRDILYVKGETMFGILHVFVVHAPSRRGGQRASEPYRMAVAERLAQSIDSIMHTADDMEENIIIMGDFNDYDKNRSIQFLVGQGMEDISSKQFVKGDKKVKGTYRYQGGWGSLDHILVSEAMKRRHKRTYIANHPCLLEPDMKYGGVKPYRFFRGPVINGGFSDHLPLISIFTY